jgi:hypothetical protein
MKTSTSILAIAFFRTYRLTFIQVPGDGQRGGQQGLHPIPNDKQKQDNLFVIT